MHWYHAPLVGPMGSREGKTLKSQKSFAKATLVAFACFFLAPLCARLLAARPQQIKKVPVLTVGIKVRQEKVRIGSTKGLRVFDGHSGRKLFSKLKPKPMLLRVDPKGFLIEGYGVRSKIRVEPLKGSLLSVDGHRYRGNFVVEEDRFGKITVINVIDVEEYLYGVIKSEMLISSPMEALKAQAVIARTFAIKHKERYTKIRGYGLSADTSSQVYTGVRGEDPRGNRAVDATRGRVLTFKGNLIDSYYHSACGGWTLNNEDAWGGSPQAYLRSRRCGYCADSAGFSWKISLTYDHILEKLLEEGHKLTSIRTIRTINDPKSGNRVLVLVIENGKGQKRMLGNMFRLAMGANVIRSAFFHMDESHKKSPGPMAKASDTSAAEMKMRELIGDYLQEVSAPRELVLDGCGSGHGVGLCQSGARGLAELGASFSEILSFYYKNTALSVFYK